jgi:hypothetical protein
MLFQLGCLSYQLLKACVKAAVVGDKRIVSLRIYSCVILPKNSKLTQDQHNYGENEKG